MLPKTHIIFGFIFSLILLLVFPEIGFLGFAIIWTSSVLIDVDHYLFYVWIKKDWNLRNAFYWFYKKSLIIKKMPRSERKYINPIVCFLHGLEALFILALLAYFIHPIFLFVLIGFAFHELLDVIKLVYEGYSLRHVSSQILNLIDFEKRGNKFVN